MISPMPHAARYNQGWRNSYHNPTAQDVLPKDGSEEQMEYVLSQGKGSLL